LTYCTQNANRHASQERLALTIVVLAAGSARRMGRQKLLLPIDGQPMLMRVMAAAAAWPIVVVAGPEVAATLGPQSARIIINEHPERGMAHSLALADAAIAGDEPIAVLLGDMPDISAATIATVVSAYNESTDIVVPRSGTRLTHPVIFGPRARKRIATLPDGDSQRTLRDDGTLRRTYVDVDVASGACDDIDTPAEYKRRAQGR
jgi:molybdenum cofactor cytidylyltransferase